MKIDPEKLSRKDRHLILGNLVVPRPIALISTVSSKGVYNLAPYAMSGIVGYHPATVYFSASRAFGMSNAGRPDGSMKDSRTNIEQVPEFVFNMVSDEMAEQMNLASASFPYGVDEFKETGLTPVPADFVKPPLVKESPVSMECRVVQIIPRGKPVTTVDIVLGEVVQIHVKDELWKNGNIDTYAYHVIGRMGWVHYTRTHDIFELPMPDLKAPP